MNLASKLFKGDRAVWIIFMFLCLISAIEVFSATSTLAYKKEVYWEPIADHATFLLGGFVLVLLLHNIHCRFYALLAGGAAVSVVLLVLLLLKIPGLVVIINGEPRWMNILGVTFQPSEIAKISLMVYTAFILSKRSWFTDRQMFWWIQGAAFLICGLIVFTNGSTAILLFCIVQMMMFFGQISIMRLLKCWGTLLLVLVTVITLLIAFPSVRKIDFMPKRVDTWIARIERWLGVEQEEQDAKTYKLKRNEILVDGKIYDLDGEDHQVVHGKIAIARGGLWGKFPGHGQQRDFLPQAYSDFIYGIVIEEMGIAGGIFVLFLYMALLFRAGLIARKCNKLFPKFLVLGCGLMLGVHALTNMAVAVDLIPVTGQPLPLISRGGTSTIISCAYIGIMLSVSRFGAHIGEEDEELEAAGNPADGAPAADELPAGRGSASAEDGAASAENGAGTRDDGSLLLEASIRQNEETINRT